MELLNKIYEKFGQEYGQAFLKEKRLVLKLS